MKESKYNSDSRIVFRETFNSYDDVVRNGGSFSAGAINIDNGICTITSGQSSITYSKLTGFDTSASFRMRIMFHTTINNNYIVNGKFGYFYALNGNTIRYRPTLPYGAVLDNTTTITPNTWYDVVGTNKYGEQKLYVNGILVNQDNATGPGGASSITLVIGSNDGATADNNFKIDLFEIYNEVLTPTEVRCLYNGTLYKAPNLDAYTILDIDPNRGNFNDKKGHTVTNTNVILAKGKNTLVGRYGGTSCLLTITDADDLSFGDGIGNDSPFSIEMWFKINKTSKTHYLVYKVQEYALFVDNGNRIYFRLYSYDSTSNYIGRYLAFNNTNWNHIVATYSGGKTNASCKIYLNGVKVDTTDAGGGSYLGMGNKAINLTITYSSTNSIFGDIAISKLRTKELTQEEITRLYNSQKHLYR